MLQVVRDQEGNELLWDMYKPVYNRNKEKFEFVWLGSRRTFDYCLDYLYRVN